MSAKIDNLPDEVLMFIFQRFDLLEKLKLRRVCWRWKQIIEYFRVKEVSIVDYNFNIDTVQFFCLGIEDVNYENLIYHSFPSFHHWLASLFIRPEEPPGSFQLLSTNAMFSGLKSMFISLPTIRNFCFRRYINPYFGDLEQLSCHGLNLTQTCLSLASLKILNLFLLKIDFDQPIRLEVPNMYKFSTDSSIDSFEFVYPQSVTHLHLQCDHKSIVRLFNLEYFSCAELLHESIMFSDLFSKLKQINVSRPPDFFLESTKQRLAAIYQAKQRLGRYEVKLCIYGMDYPIFQLHPRISPDIIIQNYLSGRLISSPFRKALSFGALVKALDAQTIPPNFKSRFSNLTRIVASSKTRENVNLFFSLLGHYPKIYQLTLNNAFDGLINEQALYDSLPSRCKYIRQLEIFNLVFSTTSSIESIDLNFVLGFTYLQMFETNLKVRSNLIRLLFEKLKYFQMLQLTGTRITKINNYFLPEYILRIKQNEPSIFYSFSNLLAVYRREIEKN